MAKQPARRRAANPDRRKKARKPNRKQASVVSSPSVEPFILRGPAAAQKSESVLKTARVRVDVKAELRPATRAVDNLAEVPVQPDDVLEIEFAEGQRVWMRADDYREQVARSSARGVLGENSVLVTPEFGVLPEQMRSRGPVTWVIKSMKVLGFDLAKAGAVRLAAELDQRASRNRPGTGLFLCTLNAENFALRAAQTSDLRDLQSAPWLLFLHGTMSSTWGSFGDLWSPARKAELAALQRQYGDRVLTFEHGTLSVSPLHNALELAKQLPTDARLHLVSHSRGGVVGELLCRSALAQPFGADQQAFFAGDERYAQPGPTGQSERELMIALSGVLREKRIKVERFVRVACPTLGTTLASGRLDRWLSVFGTIASVALPQTPVADAFSDIGDFLLEVVKERTDPRALPGLEAMMPESGLVRVLNWPGVAVGGDLAVISGDIDPNAWWAKLLVWLSDRFYAGDHDLVVNTASMYGGAARNGTAAASFHKGASVNHFTYFSSVESAQGMVRALSGDTAGFTTIPAPPKAIARAPEPSTARAFIKRGPVPTVILLPGIMGSELFVDKSRGWLDLIFLARGGLEDLAIDTRKTITAFQPVVRYYGDLQLFLEKTHKVVPFAYDWRLPVATEAARLSRCVRDEVEQAAKINQPVRIIAHSMGGLVTRTMIAEHNDVWQDMCKHPDARLLMLGTPNGGSHAITQLIVGQSTTLGGLAILDLKHKLPQLLSIITRFPGVLAMLPKDAQDDWFSPATWQRFHQSSSDWPMPESERLKDARAFRDAFDSAPLDTQRMLYVAGSADATVAGMRLDDAGQIKFLATARGDGTVTWDSGIPDGVPTWYMEVEHGDLCAHAPGFPALQELLESGRTSLLSQTPRVPRGAADLFPLPAPAEALFPTEEVFAAAMMGSRPRARRPAMPAEPPVQASVLWGDLRFARYPVAAGHYQNDGIFSAEAELDRLLNRDLTRRHRLGLYPGEVGEASFFINPELAGNRHATPQGALVIGLGKPGSLSAHKLIETFTRAMLYYALKRSELSLGIATEPGLGPEGLGISTVLVGTGSGGVSVADSVYALLLAVKSANRALADKGEAPRIVNIELIELFEDTAIEAVDTFRELNKDPELLGSFAFQPALTEARGGRRRSTYREPPGWWHRVEILGGQSSDEEIQPLRFTTSTKRARSEVSLVPTQRVLVDRFVSQAIGTTRDNRDVSRTLFELLLPNDLKNVAPDQDDIVLLLDEAAAHYPWEMLQDPAATRDEPFVLRHGLLRQLEVGEQQARTMVREVSALSALVVGDPVSRFVELKGAQREAEEVARSLQALEGMKVEKLVRREGDEVLNALFRRPYRILHLAGHGVYRMSRAELFPQSATRSKPAAGAGELVTGMILGNGILLTAAEIEQMRAVPELVFVNCCHLGYIEDRAGLPQDERNERVDYHRIAANVANQFIRIGVRVVIAAGWEVDDAAALTFSKAFYGRLLAGSTFGEAVKRARRETYERHGTTNTWGAYQCYGDPEYRLIHEALDADGADAVWLASAEHAVAKIEDVAAELMTGGRDDPKTWAAALDNIAQEAARLRWLERPRLRLALARAYGDALRLDDAVSHYVWAFENHPGSMMAEDIEQMANLMSRAALKSWLDRGPVTKTRAHGKEEADRIRQSIEILEWLLSSPVIEIARKSAGDVEFGGQTAERWSLLGGAHKRLAWMGVDPGQSLQSMLHAYDQAAKLSTLQSTQGPYSALNAICARVCASWFDAPARSLNLKQLDAEMGPILAHLESRIKDTKDVWGLAMLEDGRLLRSVVAGTLAADTLELAAAYGNAFRLASRREVDSIRDQIQFLHAMAVRAEQPVGVQLRALAEQIDQIADGSSKSARPVAAVVIRGATNIDPELVEEAGKRRSIPRVTTTSVLAQMRRSHGKRRRASR